jgi:pyruvate ferredoxin oxidoreductase gamma subunit
MIEIRFHGRGGQGAVTAVELLAQAAIAEGKFAQGFPNFGPERRGAPVTAFLRVSDQPIYLREKIEQPDVAVVLDPSLMDLVDVCVGLKPGGTLVANMPAGKLEALKKYQDRFGIATVDATRVAVETLGMPITNTAIIGALVKASGIVSIESLNAPLEHRFGRLSAKNMAALQKAYKETLVLDAPEGAASMGPITDGLTCSYEDLLKTEALCQWETLQIGCDIDLPGSSSEFETGNWRTTGRPVTDREKCIKCGFCWLLCPDNAYAITSEGYYTWDQRYCKGCGVCVVECPKKAIEMKEES